MTVPAPAPVSVDPAERSGRARVDGLDGLRGLTALYVLGFHCWLLTFRGFPDNRGPGWLGWLMYGRLGVVFFLVLSGFSLALSPARHGWRLGSVAQFARRRAWRILPPYWAALGFSLAVAWAVVPASHVGPPTGRSVAVYTLLLQDFMTAPTPNGAFWSIAVEAELYLVFPLLLLIRRRLGPVVLLFASTLPVIALGLLAPNANPVEGANALTPHLAPVFVAGVIGAGVVAADERIRRLPWHRLAVLVGAPVILLIAVKGPVWTVGHYFWIDLAIVPAMTMLLVAVSIGRPGPLRWLLQSWPVRRLGAFSYSLYLIHLPIIMVISRKIAPQLTSPGLPRFCCTLALGVPVCLGAAWVFAAIFEKPFQRHRSWASLAAAVRARRHGAARQS